MTLSYAHNGSRPCKKPKAPDCDRISYSFKTTLGIHTASRFNFEVELENIILGAFLSFEFSHMG
jgi:hypothetical protein